MGATNSETLSIDLVANGDQALRTFSQVGAAAEQNFSKVVNASRAAAGANQGFAGAVKSALDSVSDGYSSLTDTASATFAGQNLGWKALGYVVGGETQKMIAQISAFDERANRLPASIEAGFKPIVQQGYLANDRMEVLNATLQNQFALIEKKPVNGAALAIAEEKVAVDELGASLDSADSKMEAVLSANHLSRWAKLIGFAGTAKAEGTIRSFNDQTADLAYDSQSAIHDGNMDEFHAKDQERRAKDAAAHAKYQSMIADLEKKQGLQRYGYESNAANLSDYKQADSVVLNRMDADKQGDAKAANEARLAKDQEAQRVAADIEAKKQASYKAEQTLEEQHLAALKSTHIVSAAEEMNYLKTRSAIVAQGSQEYLQLQTRIGALNQQRLKEGIAEASKAKQDEYRNTMAGFEQLLAGEQRGAEMLPAEVELFWKRMQSETQKGSLAWLDINKRVGEAHQKTMHALREQLKRDSEDLLKLNEDINKGMDAWKRDDRKAKQEGFEGSDQINLIQARTAAELNATKIQEASGVTMSRVAAARATAANNTSLYAQELQTLERQLARVNELKVIDNSGDGDVTASEKQKQTNQVQDQIAQLNGARTAQVLKDSNDIKPPNSSAMVGLADATEALTRQFLDSASQVKSLFTETIGDVNKSLVDLITTRSRSGGRHIFTDLGHNLATKAAGVGIERLEGTAMSALSGIFAKKDDGTASTVSKLLGIGGGKAPTGTAGDPLHVIMAGVANTASGIGGVVKSAASGMGGGISSLASKVLGLLPAFADGVSGFGGGWAMVGERGPELMKLPGGSSIFPNSKSASMMSGGHTFHIPVDARGSTDPAQTMAMVRQGIMEAAPHIVKASLDAHREMRARTPMGSR